MVGITSATPSPGGAVVFPEVPLGVVGTFNFEEPLIRINPTDPDNVVLSSHRGMRITTDGGANFGPLITFPDVAGAVFNNGDTAMDFDSQGRLFWATLVGVAGGLGHLQVTQMDPMTGAQIGATVDVDVAAGVPGATFEDKEFLAADEWSASPYTDNLYMIWTRFPAGPAEVFFSRSTDQAVTWSTPIQLSDNPTEGFPWPADVAVAPNGDVYGAYHAGGSLGTLGTTWVLRSTDGGASFTQKTLAFTAGQSDVTFNVQGFPGTIPQTQFWMQGSVQPWVLPDPLQPGNVYVVANDDPDDVHGVGDDADVVFARSTDNGSTWITSTIPDGSAGAHQVFPFAAIDAETGTIAVAWYDTRRGLTNTNGNLLLDVFATYSQDGGQTWAPAFMVNHQDNPFDPDFPNNQRRFPEPQVVPCDASPGSTETCRIGEYFGIDVRHDVIHLDWIGNTRNVNGVVTGDQLFYSRIDIEPEPALYLSSTTGGSADGVTFADEDVLAFNLSSGDWSLLFDGSETGLPASADVNAFHVLDDDSALLSFARPAVVPSVGLVDDSDIVQFDGTFGTNTAGSFSLYLDGSDHGLTTRRERIDAITFDASGRLVVSTIGPARVPSASGPLRVRDEDLIALDIAGDWELLFDGSDVALTARSEDVWGAALDPASGELVLTAQGDYSVAALSGDRDDVIAFAGVLGTSTSGTFTLFFDGDVEGLGDERIDAVSLDP